jgi:cappuccino protein
LQFKEKFDRLCDNIDSLEAVVNRVKSDLVKIQKQVEIADEELDIPEKKLDIFLKSINIFAKPRDPNETNCNENGIYQAPEIFKSEEFFQKSQ